MPRHHAHVDVSVHTNRHGHHHHHHGHGHGHGHHHGAGVGMIVGAAAVGAVAGAAVASSASHGNRGYAPPRQETVVVVGQPGYIAPQPVYVAPQPAYVAAPPAYQTTTTTVVASQPGYAPPAAYGYGQPAYAAPQPAYVGVGAPQPHYEAGYSVTTVSAQPVYAPPAHTTVVVTTTPMRANHLGKKWNHGNIICLHNLASRQNLRIHNGFVDGSGGQGQWAQFIVERTGPERVKLRCVGMNSYLRCPGPHHLDHGPGGPQCEFWIVKHGKRGGEPVYSLESTQHPGCYVGVHDNGSIKPPMNTGLGAHGSFLVRVQRFGF